MSNHYKRISFSFIFSFSIFLVCSSLNDAEQESTHQWQSKLKGYRELLESYTCDSCCDILSHKDDTPLDWSSWRHIKQVEMYDYLSSSLKTSANQWLYGRKAIGNGLCIIKHCLPNNDFSKGDNLKDLSIEEKSSSILQCGLTRKHALNLYLKLTWALLTRGERTDLVHSLLQDALAITNQDSFKEKRIVYEYLTYAALKSGEFNIAARHMKVALTLVREEIESVENRMAVHKVKPLWSPTSLFLKSSNSTLYPVRAFANLIGKSSIIQYFVQTSSVAEEMEFGTLRSLKHMLVLLQWRLGAVLICAGGEAEGFNYLRLVADEFVESFESLLIPIAERASPKPYGGEKRQLKKLNKAYETMNMKEEPISANSHWIVWHMLRLIELPMQLPLIYEDQHDGDASFQRGNFISKLISVIHSSSSSMHPLTSSKVVSSLPIENVLYEYRHLRRYLDKYRYLEIGAKHQLGRGLLKFGYVNAGRHHIAVGSLPWEKGAEFGSGSHSARLLSSALLLPMVSSSERDLSVSLTSIEDDLTNLLSDLNKDATELSSGVDGRSSTKDKIKKDKGKQKNSAGIIDENAGVATMFGVKYDTGSLGAPLPLTATHFTATGQEEHEYKKRKQQEAGIVGTGGNPWDRDIQPKTPLHRKGSEVAGIAAKVVVGKQHLLNQTCGGSTIENALDASSPMSAAFETWPLEFWSGHYPRDEVDMLLHSAGVTKPAGRPPLSLLIAEVTRKLCPLLLSSLPPKPIVIAKPSSPHVLSNLNNVYYDNDYEDFDSISMLFSSSSNAITSSSIEASKPPLVIGIVSARMRNHAAARYITGWVQHMCKFIAGERRLRIVAMCFPTVVDHWTKMLLGMVHGSINLVPSLEESSRRISSVKPDVLIFVDLPLDFRSYALAHLRLANLQIAFWGHSHSTQLASIDYFIMPPGAAPGLLFSPTSSQPVSNRSDSSQFSPDINDVEIDGDSATTAADMVEQPALLKLASLAARVATGDHSMREDFEEDSDSDNDPTTLKKSTVGLLSNGYGSVDSGDAGFHFESRFSEQVILLGGGGSFMDPLVAADISNQSAMSSWYDALSSISLDQLMKPPSWVVAYPFLQKKLLLPEMIVSSKSSTFEEKSCNSEADFGDAADATTDSDDAKNTCKKSNYYHPPTYIALPMRTNQWHPSFDKAIASILIDGPDDLHIYVFAEHSSVEYASADDQLSRHDIHQAASPPLWEKRLRSRVASRLPTKVRTKLLRKIHWLPPLPVLDYLSLIYHASCTLDAFPVSNTLTSLDSFAVGTPMITLPLKQREGFQTTAAFWHSLLAFCPSCSNHLITNLTKIYDEEMEVYLRQLDKQGVKTGHGKCHKTTEKKSAVVEPNVQEEDMRKLKFRFGLDIDTEEDSDDEEAFLHESSARKEKMGQKWKSFSSPSSGTHSFLKNGAFMPPVVEDIEQFSQLAISLSTKDHMRSSFLCHEPSQQAPYSSSPRASRIYDSSNDDDDGGGGSSSSLDHQNDISSDGMYNNPLRKYLRGLLVACRGALFQDETYAAELRRFIISASKSSEKSGHLYPPAAGKAFIPLLR